MSMTLLQKIALQEVINDLESIQDIAVNLSNKTDKTNESITNKDSQMYKMYMLARNNQRKAKAILDGEKQ